MSRLQILSSIYLVPTACSNFSFKAASSTHKFLPWTPSVQFRGKITIISRNNAQRGDGGHKAFANHTCLRSSQCKLPFCHFFFPQCLLTIFLCMVHQSFGASALLRDTCLNQLGTFSFKTRSKAQPLQVSNLRNCDTKWALARGICHVIWHATVKNDNIRTHCPCTE